MHQPLCIGNGGPAGFADRLMPQADAENRNFAPQRLYHVDTNSRILRTARSGGENDGLRIHPSDLIHCGSIIPNDINLRIDGAGKPDPGIRFAVSCYIPLFCSGRFPHMPLCNKKVPDRKNFCQGRINNPRCHLDLQHSCTLNRIPSYPWHLTCAIRCRILGRCKPAFHCTLSGPFDDLFSARSQLAGLSVGASSPLSPPHRFR